MEQGNGEKKDAPLNEAKLRNTVHGIVSEVFEQKEQERQKSEARTARRGHKRTVLLSLALGFLVAWVAFSTLIPALFSQKERAMPHELLGLWTTPAERYADRALEIQESSLIFHTGDGEFTTHPIQQVSRTVSDTVVLYHVDYIDEEVVYTLSFYYEPTPVDKIRFQNQLEMEWSR
jgi:hypothetical protein